MLRKSCNYNANPSETLNNLTISAVVGVYPHERIATQSLVFCVQTELEPLKIKPHDFDHTLKQVISNYCKAHQPQLLEKLAFDLATYILNLRPEIIRMVLTIKKPEALSQAEYSYLSITMTRSGEKITL